MKREQKIEKVDYGKFLLLALFEPFLYFMGESFGLTLVSSTVAAVIVSTIPVISPMFAYLFVKEKISLMNFIGLIISFSGIMLMVFNRDFTFDASPLGVLLEFCAVMAAIFYSVAIKKLTHKYSAFTIIKVQNMLGAIYFLPLFLIFDFNRFISITPDFELIYSLLMLAVFASSAAFILYIPVIRELGIIKANIFTNFIPVFTAITSYFVLSETFDMGKILGMTVVIAGVIVSQVYKKQTELNK
jgi:drug/metabolite transporter (DMT)-like permease